MTMKELDVELEFATIRRDQQALWTAEWYLALISGIRSACGWYRGERGSARPEVLVSALVRPAEDGDKGWTHRMMSLSRVMKQRDSLASDNYALFVRTGYLAVEELKKLEELPVFDQLKSELEDLVTFIERKSRDREDDPVYRERLEAHIRKVKERLEEISDALVKIETLLSGGRLSDAAEQSVLDGVMALKADTESLKRRGKVTPAGSRTRSWVVGKVEYYFGHPEACVTDVSRTRIYVRDVWESVRREAESYGVTTLEQFRRIYNTAMRSSRRAKASEKAEVGSD